MDFHPHTVHFHLHNILETTNTRIEMRSIVAWGEVREEIDHICRIKEIFSTGKTAWSVEVLGLQAGGVDLKNPWKKVKFGGLRF